MGKFRCTGCGGCCKRLLNDRSGRLFGLYLDPSETRLFPSDVVFPLLGTGNPVEITAYQLGVNQCVHYEEAGGVGRCRIHAERPVACRAYPVIGAFEVTDQCLAVRQSPEGIDRDSLSDELAAHNKKIEQMLERPETQWVWPLDRREWIPIERIGHDRVQPLHPREA